MDSNPQKLGYTFRVCFAGISMARPFAGTVKKVDHSLKHHKFGNRN
jgi:hypothetical protein